MSKNLKILYIAFDNDNWGRKFTQDLLKVLDKRIIPVLIELPIGKKDVGELSETDWEILIKKYNLPQEIL